MYSSHRIDSVTCLRLSSRCTVAQSGSACRRWPCRVPGPAPALANSRASSTVSVTSSGNGQVSPDASNRRIVSRTVEGAAPTRRAISRLGIPADFNLITSRTWRIASLSVGIQVPLRKAERRDRIGARRGRVTPGEIIPECWARSSRNGGRHQIGTVGEITPEWWATSSGISTVILQTRERLRREGNQAPFCPPRIRRPPAARRYAELRFNVREKLHCSEVPTLRRNLARVRL